VRLGWHEQQYGGERQTDGAENQRAALKHRQDTDQASDRDNDAADGQSHEAGRRETKEFNHNEKWPLEQEAVCGRYQRLLECIGVLKEVGIYQLIGVRLMDSCSEQRPEYHRG
jgi:hypothetical protein